MLKLVYLLIFLMNTTFCGSKKSSVLYVGTNAEFPPFEYIENNEIKGFDIDIIKALAKELDYRIVIKNLSWDGLLPALQSKKIDLVIAGMTMTKDRNKVVNFSDGYYISQEQMIMVCQDNNTIEKIENLKDYRVGVILGFTGDVIVSALDNIHKIERFNSVSQAIISLKNNKIDALILDYEPAQKYKIMTSGIKLIPGNNTQEVYSIALHKNDLELLYKVNLALHKIKENGIYDLIYQKYF